MNIRLICRALVFFAAIVVSLAGAEASAELGKRLVPQLGLSVLSPVKVAFDPNRDDLILVVNEDGRIDLLDISEPDHPLKVAEIFAAARDAAFSPQGNQIVSGGQDGTVRLWRLDGTPAGEPFKAHKGPVTSVAFSPQSDRIVSGGSDGTVRLWQLDGTPAAAPFKGHDDWVGSVGFRRLPILQDHGLWRPRPPVGT